MRIPDFFHPTGSEPGFARKFFSLSTTTCNHDEERGQEL
jgi:hypothetical protein